MKPTQSDTDSPKLVATFTVDGEPVSKSRARFTKRGSKTFAYTPEKTKAGEERVAWTYRSLAKGVPSDPEIAYRVEMHFFNGTRQRRDVDNMVKLILDGLNGVAWVDDNQVTQIEARKSYVTKAEARTEVRLYKVGSLNPPKRKCPGCGAEFRTYESWNGKIHCTAECGNRARRLARTRPCAFCGVDFVGHDSSAKYCSMECRSEDGRAQYECAECGVQFRDQKSLGRARKNLLCSDECSRAWHARLERECVHGHARSDYETVRSNGRRYCRECQRLRVMAGRPPRAAATHCSKGHPFDEENTRITKKGHRVCKQCESDRGRAYRIRKQLRFTEEI